MKTKIILELGCNHQGDIDIAKEMILDAHKLGVWGIKFQKRDIENMPDKEKNILREPAVSLGLTNYEHRKKLELSIDQLAELKELAHRKGLKFICSAFDENSLQDLVKLECDYYKLPSQLFTNESMFYLANDLKILNKMILSTGMHTLEEVAQNYWLDICYMIMHCVSIYPAKMCQLNMSALHYLIKYKYSSTQNPLINIGYSSHGINGKDILYAVIAGATCIERHYTISKTMKGNDHETVSSDFKEIQQVIRDIEFAESIVGDKISILCEEEKKVRLKYRGF